MHIDDFMTKRDSIVKAWKRGVVSLEDAYAALDALFRRIGFVESNHFAIHELLNREG